MHVQNGGAGAAAERVPNAPADAITAPQDSDPLQIPSQSPQSRPLPTKKDEQVCLCLCACMAVGDIRLLCVTQVCQGGF